MAGVLRVAVTASCRGCGAPLHQDLYKTAIEFLKLEKIELGGARGNILGSLVMHIYEEVFELVKVFADCKYDPLDPGDPVRHVGGPWLGQRQTPQEWGARGGGARGGGSHMAAPRQ